MCSQCACWLRSVKTATSWQFIGASDNKNRISPFNLIFLKTLYQTLFCFEITLLHSYCTPVCPPVGLRGWGSGVLLYSLCLHFCWFIPVFLNKSLMKKFYSSFSSGKRLFSVNHLKKNHCTLSHYNFFIHLKLHMEVIEWNQEKTFYIFYNKDSRNKMGILGQHTKQIQTFIIHSSNPHLQDAQTRHPWTAEWKHRLFSCCSHSVRIKGPV